MLNSSSTRPPRFSFVRRTVSGWLWRPSLGLVYYYVNPVERDQKSYCPAVVLSWGLWSLLIYIRSARREG